MSRESRLIKNTAILSVGTLLPRLASVVTLPILTGCLTKEEYGTYDLLTILVSLFLPSITLQIQAAAFRFLIDVREKEEEVRRIVTNIFAFTLPVSLAALFIFYFFLPMRDRPVKLLICVYFLVDILTGGARQVARGLAQNAAYSVSTIISASGRLIFTLLFVWYCRAGLSGAVAALSGAMLLSLLVLLWQTKLYRCFDLRLLHIQTLKTLLRYSWPMVPNSMSMWVMRVSDRLVVTAFLGVSANAVYSVANKIPALLTLAQSSFAMAWQESASVASKDSDAETYYSSMFRSVFDLMAGFLGLLICVTPLLFVLLISGEYEDAYYQMPLLFLGMFFHSISAFLGGIYIAYKKIKSVGITTIAAAACNLIVDITLIRSVGLYAASGSTLVSYLLLFAFRAVDVRKLVKIKYDGKHILLVLGILTVESVFSFMRRPLFDGINIIFGITAFLMLNRKFVKTVFQKWLKIIKKMFEKIKQNKKESIL